MIDPLVYFWLAFKAALLSTGGNGSIPLFHHDLTVRGWVTDKQLAESLAIGQISPGPSGLWIISLGYLVDGLRGSILSLIAITLPPLLVLVINSFYQRVGGHPAMQGFVRGLSLAVVGIFTVVLLGIMSTAGWNTTNVLIALGALALGATRRVPVIGVLALAALVGILLY